MSNFVKLLAATTFAPVYFTYKVLEGVAKVATAQKSAGVHGNADFATYRELKRSGYLRPDTGFVVAKTDNWKTIYGDPEDSLLMVGRKGSGKSLTTKANLLHFARLPAGYRPDLIVTDAVGELERDTRAELEKGGYGVVVLNLRNPGETPFSYNPLNYIDVKNKYDFDFDVTALAELLVPPDPNSKEPHFVDIAQAVVASAIGYYAKYEQQNATLGRVVRELAASKEGFDAILAKVEKAPDAIITQGITAINAAGQKNERGGIFTSMSRKLRPFMTEAVGKLTDIGLDANGVRRRGWDWEQVYESDRPTVVFIRTGLNRASIAGPFVRIVIGNALNTRGRMLDRSDDMFRFKKPLRVIADEAGDIGNCRPILYLNNKLRKADATCALFYLDMDEIKQAFPDWKTLVSGCSLIVPGGMSDMEFYSSVSRAIGETTVNESSTRDDGGKSKSERMRPRFKPDEIRRMEPGEVIVLMPNMPAVMGNKVYLHRGKVRL